MQTPSGGVIFLHGIVESNIPDLSNYIIKYDLEYWHNTPGDIENSLPDNTCNKCGSQAISVQLVIGICNVFDKSTNKKVEPSFEEYFILSQIYPPNTVTNSWCATHEPQEEKDNFWRSYTRTYDSSDSVVHEGHQYTVVYTWRRFYIPNFVDQVKCFCGDWAHFIYQMTLKKVTKDDGGTALSIDDPTCVTLCKSIEAKENFRSTCYKHKVSIEDKL